MHRDITKTVLVHKDRDNDRKRGQQYQPPPPQTTTTTTGPARSLVCWQPPPHVWPSTVQNPVIVWGSTDPAWVNQQVPYYQQSSQQNQSQRYFKPQHQQNQQNVVQSQQQPSSIPQQRQPGSQQCNSVLNTL
ncbi:hypothetical protein DPMN_116437 [Dreissena polymorpha]|uniref:Uncharacterized protein n=1 Tax=Dreissena polymorpha TaxID=45954 RepID=A0A9D4KN17_DREPO|nr:hypothetical protein DPMN_116437 [Dreissena polymorpha]